MFPVHKVVIKKIRSVIIFTKEATPKMHVAARRNIRKVFIYMIHDSSESDDDPI